MNTSLKILSELIGHLHEFESEKGKAPIDLEDFLLWLNGIVFKQDIAEKSEKEENKLNIQLTHLLVLQSKHFKMYCKKALHDSTINTPDDYSFLYHLNFVDSFRKMELINMHSMEAPSGIEVIKRLMKKELIEEFDDTEDKRAKRVRITKKGSHELKKLYPVMQKVYEKMTAELPVNEKLLAIYYLQKLNDYHLKESQY